MKLVLMKMMMTISTTIIYFKNPMTMGMALLLFTLLATILMSKMMVTSWMAMMMFLIMIGGLLIIFMYMSSIASNQKFKTNISLLLFLMIAMIPLEDLMSENQINEYLKNYKTIEMSLMMKMYNKKSWMLTLLMFMYMLICMISITKIVKMHLGPLRMTKTYE